MRLSVDHHTTYIFTEPQARLVQLLRMTPSNSHDQTVADWHIAVDCDARMSDHVDGFGNATTMLYVEGPVERIEIAVTGEVVTSNAAGILHGSHEVLPARTFLRTTPTTLADEAIAAFAREAAGDGEADLAALHRLNVAVGERFAWDKCRPEPGLSAADAFGRERLTARDQAQILVAAARAIDVPARYVTGYCDLGGGHRPTPHGWAELWLAQYGWIGFDPTLQLSPEESHVRVAAALDAAGSSPVAGSRLGEGEERMEVDVQVTAED